MARIGFYLVCAELEARLHLVRAGEIGIGVTSAAALYVITLFGPINQALFVLDYAVRDREPGPPCRGSRPHPFSASRCGQRSAAHSAIRACSLAHAYRPGHEVLAGIDLEIAEGERVALVGESGAGKTTLATLLAGMHRPTRGTVLLGADTCRGTTGQSVALVTQEVHVYARTVTEDLRLADPAASGSALWSALARVGAAGWVAALPPGIETVVGHGGHRLTSVQAQQLALARLVLTAPRVAVLDEATAGAGSAGAALLERAVDETVRGRTSILVAHRLNQAQNADLVLVLHQGPIVERGSHDELLAAGGRYSAMWSEWSGPRCAGRRDTRSAVEAPRNSGHRSDVASL